MTQFKAGDRVRYTGKQEMLSPYLVGKTATVTMVASDGYVHGLDWDDKTEKHKSCFAGNLELIEDDRLARLEAFVARVASDALGGRSGYGDEARALVAEIAPIDPDLIEARKIAMDEYQPSAWNDEQWESRVMAGDEDEDRSVRSALAGIRRGRALERGES